MSSRSFVIALVALALSACTFLLKTDATQCSTDADCHARGGVFATASCVANECVAPSGPFACLASPPALPVADGSTLNITMTFVDEVTFTPYGAVSVRPCPKLDVTCAKPLSAAVTSGNDGVASLTLPKAFDGYLEINSSKTMPALWYFSPLPTTERNYNVGLLTPASFQTIAQAAGATIDPNAGHSFNIALDCTENYGTYAKGVSFTADQHTGGTRLFYLINGLPSTSADQTDASGIGGFANLPPGIVTVTASVAATGQRSGSVSGLIRAGVITYAPIAPNP
jgi:hypothetical protein